jgi:glycosyltransferase involved in cell wall biosynthesis
MRNSGPTQFAVPDRNGTRETDSFHGRAVPARLLHIGKYYPPHAGGMETVLRDLVSHQSSLLPVEVVVANDRPSTKTEMLNGARITRVARYGTLASQPLCPSLPWKIAATSETLVHLHLPNPWGAQAYLMSKHRGKLIVSHHADTLGRPFLRKLVSATVRRVMQRAAAIIVSSHSYMQSSDELADFRDKCHVVPLGIDLETSGTSHLLESRHIQTKYGPVLILAVGRLVPYKGFEFLLRAMTGIDATLLLIGTGPLQASLQNLIKELGLQEKVHLLGRVNDLAPYYHAARMFVMPSISRAEAFGLVQVEAMAAGIPVVNTQIDSGVPEVSLDGITGITVPPRSPEAMARAITLLLDNPGICQTYGQAAILRARERFSAQRMASATLEVYESAL